MTNKATTKAEICSVYCVIYPLKNRALFLFIPKEKLYYIFTYKFPKKTFSSCCLYAAVSKKIDESEYSIIVARSRSFTFMPVEVYSSVQSSSVHGFSPKKGVRVSTSMFGIDCPLYLLNPEKKLTTLTIELFSRNRISVISRAISQYQVLQHGEVLFIRFVQLLNHCEHCVNKKLANENTEFVN